jgi:hypothetical protein
MKPLRRATTLAAAVLLVTAPAGVRAALPPVLGDADVARISWGTRDGEARALAAQGRCAEARALVDAPGPGPALVRAWLSDCARDPDGVIAATDGLAEALPAAAPLARALRAEALLTRSRPAPALDAVRCETSPPARRLRARALREIGAHGPAAVAYRALIASESREDRALGLLGFARLLLEVVDGGMQMQTPPPALSGCLTPPGEALPRDRDALTALARSLPVERAPRGRADGV